MSLHVDAIEALWAIVNGTTLVLTLLAFWEARRDLIIAKGDKSPSHEARELTASGNLRREALRVAVQVLLLSIVVPGLLSDRPITLSPALLALMAVPVVIFLSTVFDARDRSRLAVMLIEIVRADRDALALESSVQSVGGAVQDVKADVQEAIAVGKIAAEKAEGAFDVGNHVQEKFAGMDEKIIDLKTELLRLTEIVGHKEDKP